MTTEQCATLTRALGYTKTADPEGVIRALDSLRYADRHRTDPTAVSRALAAALTVAKRLLAVESDYATVRSTIARLEVANHRGDDYGLSDLAFELEQAGVDLKDDYDTADDLLRAQEREAL